MQLKIKKKDFNAIFQDFNFTHRNRQVNNKIHMEMWRLQIGKPILSKNKDADSMWYYFISKYITKL